MHIAKQFSISFIFRLWKLSGFELFLFDFTKLSSSSFRTMRYAISENYRNAVNFSMEEKGSD